jgi:hypothetical protein
MSFPEKTSQTGPKDQAFRMELLDLIKRHVGGLPADRALAAAAYVVGQLIAVQDQRVMTPELAIQIVNSNIDLGNANAVFSLIGETKGSA